MSKLKKRKRSVSDDTLEVCRVMYMEHTPLSQIAREMNVPRSTLQYYENSMWRSERELVSSELLSTISSKRLHSLHELNGGGVKILSRAVQNLVTRKDPPSTREAMDIVKIMEVLDKLASYADNKDSGGEVLPADFIDVTDPFEIEESDK